MNTDGDAVDRSGSYAVATPINGTPRRLVLSVPDSALLLTAHSHTMDQRLGLGVLTLIGLLTCWLGIRLRTDRRALRWPTTASPTWRTATA